MKFFDNVKGFFGSSESDIKRKIEAIWETDPVKETVRPSVSFQAAAESDVASTLGKAKFPVGSALVTCGIVAAISVGIYALRHKDSKAPQNNSQWASRIANEESRTGISTGRSV